MTPCRALAVTMFLLPMATIARTAATSIQIVEPAGGQPVIGETTIKVSPSIPEGVHQLKIEIYVDGRRVATLLEPPFTATWQAGDGTDPHVIRAKVWASDGTTAEATVRTVPLMGVERANVLLVEVYVTVRSESGSFVMDLGRDDFKVSEDGAPQTLSLFTAERKPVHVVLLLDVSASMKREERLSNAIEAARIFVEALEPRDRVSLVVFSDTVTVLEPFTIERAPVLASIESVEAQRGTALYDAIHAGARLVGENEGRRALVLLSDGQDLAFDGLGPGSSHTFEEAVQEALRHQVLAYTIGLGAQLENDYDYAREHSAEEVLTHLASETGGRFFAVQRPGRLRKAFERILDELRFQYTLGYSPTNGRRDGSWRRIEVTVARPRLEVTARKGYYAPVE